MVFLCPWRVVRQRPVLGSQSLTRWSFDPETRRPLVGCQSTDFTSHPWPVREDSSTPPAKSKILRVESSEAVTNLESVGENARSRIGSLWAWITLTLLKFGCQYLTMPSWSADRSQSSLCEYEAALIAESCACGQPLVIRRRDSCRTVFHTL
jgi:hypothetical protein